MSWEDRLRQAAYTPPSGRRITFDYENVQEIIQKKTPAFNFPGVNGTHFQDLGHTGRQRPMRCFFTGENHDLDANRFTDALLEIGPGRLEHPFYGTLNVIPFDRIKRRDDLKTSANQTIFEVVFWENLDILFPTATLEPSSEILSVLSDFTNGLIDQFTNAIGLDTASETSSFKVDFEAAIGATNSILGTVAATSADVEQQFSAIRDSLRGNLLNVVLDIPTIAAQASALVQTPAFALGNILDQLGSYGTFIEEIIAGSGIRIPGFDLSNQNAFLIDDIFVSSAVSGSIISSLNTTFRSKSEALETIDFITTLQESSTEWRDDNYRSFS